MIFLKGSGSYVAALAASFALYLVLRILFPGIPEDVVSRGYFLTLAAVLVVTTGVLLLILFGRLVDLARGRDRNVD